MPYQRFADLKVVIYDPNRSTIGLTRQALQQVGMRAIRAFRDPEQALTYCKEEECDLFIADFTSSAEESAALIEQLRDPAILGHNFDCIVGLIAASTRDAIDPPIFAGADSVILKPLQPSMIENVLIKALENKLPYIHQEHYDGPDRRRLPDAKPYEGEEHRQILSAAE